MTKQQNLSYARQQIMRDLIRSQANQVDNPTERYQEVLAELAKIGLPETDAIWFYNKMQRDGWSFGGVKILDWEATVASFNKHKFFPSQR